MSGLLYRATILNLVLLLWGPGAAISSQLTAQEYTVLVVPGKTLGERQGGAGVVVGCASGKIYAMTAHHLFTKSEGLKIPEPAQVVIRNRSSSGGETKTIDAKNVQVVEEFSERDLALIVVAVPEGTGWECSFEVPYSDHEFHNKDLYTIRGNANTSLEKIDSLNISMVDEDRFNVQANLPEGYSGGSVVNGCGQFAGTVPTINPGKNFGYRARWLFDEVSRLSKEYRFSVALSRAGGCSYLHLSKPVASVGFAGSFQRIQLNVEGQVNADRYDIKYILQNGTVRKLGKDHCCGDVKSGLDCSVKVVPGEHYIFEVELLNEVDDPKASYEIAAFPEPGSLSWSVADDYDECNNRQVVGDGDTIFLLEVGEIYDGEVYAVVEGEEYPLRRDVGKFRLNLEQGRNIASLLLKIGSFSLEVPGSKIEVWRAPAPDKIGLEVTPLVAGSTKNARVDIDVSLDPPWAVEFVTVKNNEVLQKTITPGEDGELTGDGARWKVPVNLRLGFNNVHTYAEPCPGGKLNSDDNRFVIYRVSPDSPNFYSSWEFTHEVAQVEWLPGRGAGNDRVFFNGHLLSRDNQVRRVEVVDGPGDDPECRTALSVELADGVPAAVTPICLRGSERALSIWNDFPFRQAVVAGLPQGDIAWVAELSRELAQVADHNSFFYIGRRQHRLARGKDTLLVGRHNDEGENIMFAGFSAKETLEDWAVVTMPRDRWLIFYVDGEEVKVRIFADMSLGILQGNISTVRAIEEGEDALLVGNFKGKSEFTGGSLDCPQTENEAESCTYFARVHGLLQGRSEVAASRVISRGATVHQIAGDPQGFLLTAQIVNASVPEALATFGEGPKEAVLDSTTNSAIVARYDTDGDLTWALKLAEAGTPLRIMATEHGGFVFVGQLADGSVRAVEYRQE